MRRLVGYDLNGWRDLAARNWLEQPGGDVAEVVEHAVSGGVGGVVVRLDDGGCERLIGGAQALRAPHGLGPGWGAIGAMIRRTRVTDLLANPAGHVPELAAALRGMADPAGAGWRAPTTAVLAIPDVAAYEEEQEILLQTLRVIRVTGDSLLVWRPVLACLAALESGIVGDAARVGIVGHAGAGLTSQRLLVKEHRGIRAPERRETGQLHAWGGGLDALRRQAWRALVEASATPDRADHLTNARILTPLALGDTPEAEVVRQPSGSWEVVAPAPPDFCLPPIAPALVERLDACEIVIVDTPTTGGVRKALVDALTDALPIPVHPLAHQEVARGGLLAAGRIARGEPVYFDFLPQLSTIVQDAVGARSFDLIPPDAVLPAGRTYRSSEPARLGLSADTTTIKVYLRKQQADACRLAEVPLVASAGRTATVTLDVEQAPAAGRARLTLASDAFSAPLQVDWERAQPLEDSWEALIESLQRPVPAIPNRVVLPCGLDVWHGQDDRAGLEELLIHSVERGAYDWDRLATMMSARPFGRYAISSDGKLPDGLGAAAVEALGAATDAAEAHVLGRLDGTVQADNDSLKFLTWQFRRCPRSVVAPLVQSLAAGVGGHPFVWHHANRQLVYHALGRIARDEHADEGQIAKVFVHMLGLPEGTWNRDNLACTGFLLSRTDTAPVLLDTEQIRRIGAELVRRNEDAVGRPYTSRYLYVPIVLLGLVRCRLRDPWSLVAGQDAVADDLLSSTSAVIDDMRHRFPGDQRIGRYRAMLEDACDWLRGEGRNPDILLDLTNLASP